MRRVMSGLLSAALLAGMLGTGATASAAEERVTLKASKAGDEIAVTLSVKNTRFNAVQTALTYDTTRLEPVAAPDAERTTVNQAEDMTEFVAPFYERGQGWLALGGSRLDQTEGTVEYVLYVDENSKNRTNGSDAEGYVTADSAGTELLRLYFKPKAGATLYADSIRLAGVAGNETGVIISMKAAGEGGTPEIVTDAATVAVDLSAVAESGNTPSDKTDSGTSGGGSGSGNGSSGGSGSGGSGAQTKPVDSGSTGGQGEASKSGDGLSDIDGHWAADSIRALVARGVLTGRPDGTFHPDDGMTRGELAVVLVKAMGEKGNGGAVPFGDTEGHWARTYIAAATASGYMQGIGGGRFDPDGLVTREMLAVVLSRALGLADGTGAAFTDGASISGWAVGGVAAAAVAGIVTGAPDGSFQPTRTATRAEAAAMLLRSLEQR